MQIIAIRHSPPNLVPDAKPFSVAQTRGLSRAFPKPPSASPQALQSKNLSMLTLQRQRGWIKRFFVRSYCVGYKLCVLRMYKHLYYISGQVHAHVCYSEVSPAKSVLSPVNDNHAVREDMSSPARAGTDVTPPRFQTFAQPREIQIMQIRLNKVMPLGPVCK